MFSFENLRVYQAARQLVKDVYLLQNKSEDLDALRPQFTEVAKMLSGLRKSLTVIRNWKSGSARPLVAWLVQERLTGVGRGLIQKL